MNDLEKNQPESKAMIPVAALAMTFGIPVARLAANLIVKGLDLIDGGDQKKRADQVVTEAGLLKVYTENGRFYCANTNSKPVLCTLQKSNNQQYPNGNVNYQNESLSFTVDSLTSEDITDEIKNYGENGALLNNYPESPVKAADDDLSVAALRDLFFSTKSFAGALLAISGGDIIINRYSDPSRRWFNVQSTFHIANFKFRFVDVAGNEVSGTAQLLDSSTKAGDDENHEYDIDLPAWVDPEGPFNNFQVQASFTPDNFDALMARSKKKLEHLPIPDFVMAQA